MGVAVGRGGLGVSQQLPDHGQSLAQPGGDTGERMPEIVKSNIIETRLSANVTPGLLSIHQVGAALLTDDDIRVVIPSLDLGQDF